MHASELIVTPKDVLLPTTIALRRGAGGQAPQGKGSASIRGASEPQLVRIDGLGSVSGLRDSHQVGTPDEREFLVVLEVGEQIEWRRGGPFHEW